MIGLGPQPNQTEFIKDLTHPQLEALPYLFEFWALPHQVPPLGDWRTWAILGGRGAGKTRAGAEWVRSLVEGPRPTSAGQAKRFALVGETADQAREVMVLGESGLLAVSPPDRRPTWHASRRMLSWPNGAIAYVLSAHEPDALRGYQFDYLWADEVAKWRHAQDSWDMLQLGLRLGDDPRACVTTTPRNIPFMHALVARGSTVATHAATQANRANLARGFLDEINARYFGTTLGKQEVEGLLLVEEEGALWSAEQLARLTCDVPPVFDRIVVSVDPVVSHHAGSDMVGIVVVGARLRGPVQEWRAVVLEDASVKTGSPTAWGEVVVDAYHRHNADRIIAEVNQGGALVQSLIQSIDPSVAYKPVHAQTGKISRAEPVAGLYEQGRVAHLKGLQDLEAQMCLMTHQGYTGKGSPDRVDALVWALQELLLVPIKSWRQPSVKGL